MSLSTWIAEFVDDEEPYDLVDALEKAIQKWRGVLPTSLMKHGVTLHMHLVRDEEDVWPIDRTCSVCHFMDAIKGPYTHPCVRCYRILKHDGCMASAEYLAALAGHPQALLKKLRSRLRSIK